MNIIGVSTVRNEQDIIEAFVRHTLAFCDRLLIMDHGSTDATPQILKSLQDEGLALDVVRDDTVGRLQAIFMNRLALRAAQEFHADWIFFLDADEFIQGDARRALTERSVPGGPQYLLCGLINYVVRLEDDAAELNPVRRIRHRTIDFPDSDRDRSDYKCIVAGALVREKGFSVNSGNHQASVQGEEPPFEILQEIWLGHFSLRSPSQYGSKVVSVIFQRYGQRAKQAGNADFYHTDYARLRQSYTEFARNFSDIKLAWGSRTITGVECCPIDYEGGELRYPQAAPDVDQFIKNTVDLGLHIAQMNASTPAEAEEATVVFIALKDGAKTLQKQSMEANIGSPRELRFQMENLNDRRKLTLEISSGPGMLEIDRVTMKFADGSQQEFCGKTLGELITVERDGMAARGGSVQRIFTSIPPVALNLWGNTHQAIELSISLRFINQPRMTSMAIGDYSGIQWFNRQFKLQEQRPEPVQTPLNTTFALNPLEQSCAMIGKGWQKLRFTGLGLSKDRAQLGLRFPKVLKGRIRVYFEIRIKHDPQQLRDQYRNVRISVDGAPVALWQLGKKRRQWLEVHLAAEPLGRHGVDLIFEAEESPIKFWIQRARVETLYESGWISGALRQMLSILERRESSRKKQIRIGCGETVGFSTGERGLEIATKGWAPPEKSGIQAEAPTAVLRFSIAPQSAHELKVRLLLTGGCTAGVVRLAWESEHLISCWLEARTSQWVEAPLPSHALKRDEVFLLLHSSQKSAGFELREMLLTPASRLLPSS